MKRDGYFDFLRGVAIFMVIGIHTYVDGFHHFNLFLRQFLNCAVPIFLSISGYFIGRKSFEQKGSYVSFLKKQLPRVYIPMLIWSIPWFLMDVANGVSPLYSTVRVFIGDMSIFYFIPLIMQLYLLTPLIQKLNYRYGGGYSVVLTLLGMLLFDYLTKVKGWSLSLLLLGAPVSTWMVFYVMGVLYAQHLKQPFIVKKPVIWIFIGIVLCCAQIVVTNVVWGRKAIGIKLSSHIYTYFVILWLFSDSARFLYNKICENYWVSKVRQLGIWSFYVYLNHCLILETLNRLHVFNFWYFKWALCFFLSYLFAWITQKILPLRFWRYVGF